MPLPPSAAPTTAPTSTYVWASAVAGQQPCDESRIFKGTGVGLVNCKALCEAEAGCDGIYGALDSGDLSCWTCACDGACSMSSSAFSSYLVTRASTAPTNEVPSHQPTVEPSSHTASSEWTPISAAWPTLPAPVGAVHIAIAQSDAEESSNATNATNTTNSDYSNSSNCNNSNSSSNCSLSTAAPALPEWTGDWVDQVPVAVSLDLQHAAFIAFRCFTATHTPDALSIYNIESTSVTGSVAMTG